MKKFILSVVAGLLLCTGALAQEGSKSADEVKKENSPVSLKAGETIVRGNSLASNVKSATIAQAFAEPAKFEGKTVEIKGVIIRSCKAEGCWMELADKKGGRSVRVTFGDHAFFIPLNAAGLSARAQGVFKVKTLSKEHVDHLIADDGAKFDNRNPDGSVTEISFDASGVELAGVE